jgi:hypothetical protein
VGPERMSDRQPAFYATTGTVLGDMTSLIHVPYTLWHLSYVAIGAALAPRLDWLILAGTLTAFAVGLGVGAHALDEVRSRPLGTGLPDRVLWTVGVGGLAVSLGIAVAGMFIVSPWVLAWGVAGALLAAGYALEWPPILHTDLGFALAWGAFPVLVGYWAQTNSLSSAAIAVAGAATLLSLAQRALSTRARFVRRRTEQATARFDGGREWERHELLSTWEAPLRFLTWSAVALAIGLLLTHL